MMDDLLTLLLVLLLAPFLTLARIGDILRAG
jgi:hypothetical protein